jgi:uncharacterized protein
MYQLSQIWIYPIKSLGGIALQSATVETRGLQHDRRWMLVDASGRFVSQREIAEMALMRTAISDGHLEVFHKNTPSDVLRIPLDLSPRDLEQHPVTIWDDTCIAAVLPQSINNWFSAVLKHDLRLVFMPETTRRQADERFADKGQHVSFADGFPFLIIGQSTLDDLNARLPTPLPMNRFRPNFVFTGGQAFEEDNWSDFQIGNSNFRGVKPCARCIIPTTDQETAIRTAEPIKTLATYRKFGQKICFGQNLVWTGEPGAIVQVGDMVVI